MNRHEFTFDTMSTTKDRDPLEVVEEFYRLLTEHQIPEGYTMSNLPPKMTEEQAFSLIWFLQEGPHVFPDHIERCESCGDLGDSWSENFEYLESKGMRLCESCYTSKGAFECCSCDQHDYHEAPGRLAVLTEQSGDMEPGLYRITSWPFYANGMITGFLFESAFDRVGDAPPEVDTNGYPMGFLCCACEAKLHPAPKVDHPVP